MELHSVGRKLVAIFAVDVEGYRGVMGRDEVGTLHAHGLPGHHRGCLIASHRGGIFNRVGEGILVEFGATVHALRGAGREPMRSG